MIAQLICNLINPNKVVEFSNVSYIDENTIMPTISERLSKMGKKAKLMSPNIETDYSKNFSTININKNIIYFVH